MIRCGKEWDVPPHQSVTANILFLAWIFDLLCVLRTNYKNDKTDIESHVSLSGDVYSFHVYVLKFNIIFFLMVTIGGLSDIFSPNIWR